MSHNTKDPFDVWLGLVVNCVINPLVDVCRLAVWRPRTGGESGPRNRRCRSRRKRRRRSHEGRS